MSDPYYGGGNRPRLRWNDVSPDATASRADVAALSERIDNLMAIDDTAELLRVVEALRVQVNERYLPPEVDWQKALADLRTYAESLAPATVEARVAALEEDVPMLRRDCDTMADRVGAVEVADDKTRDRVVDLGRQVGHLAAHVEQLMYRERATIRWVAKVLRSFARVADSERDRLTAAAIARAVDPSTNPRFTEAAIDEASASVAEAKRAAPGTSSRQDDDD